MPADRSQLRDAVLDGNGPRAFILPTLPDPPGLERAAGRARELGFDSLILALATPADPDASRTAAPDLNRFARAAHDQGLLAATTLCLDRIRSDHPQVQQVPAATYGMPPPVRQAIVDPRGDVAREVSDVRLRRPQTQAVQAWWRRRAGELRDLGIDYFAAVPANSAGRILAAALGNAGYAVQVFARPTAAPFPHDDTESCPLWLEDPAAEHLVRAPIEADGWAIDEAAAPDEAATMQWLNRLVQQRGRPRAWTGPGSPLRIVSRLTDFGAVLLVRNETAGKLAWPPADLPPMPWQAFAPVPGYDLSLGYLAPGAVALLEARARPPVMVRDRIDARVAAEPRRRVVATLLSPNVNEGAYCAKTVLGRALSVRAAVFADGHEKLAASVLTRAVDETTWQAAPMTLQGNDVWLGQVRFDRIGRHEIRVEGWLDLWGGFARDLALKLTAGQDVSLEMREAAAMIEAACQSAPSETLRRVLAELALPGADPATLLDETLADAMHQAAERKFLASSHVQPIEVEREAAGFSAWYELFPRSQGAEGRHGTLMDVIGRLPHIAAMGFDTLYFPPIHPIGRRNRKGRNNALAAAPDDVGSPYAIGSDEGGHDAVHPDLGTLADFRALVAAAAAHGLEIALDFAIQCAPDHPWLREHPGWFAWRPDGSIKYAENPPKKYQDIVNVDFYAKGAVPDLWQALRDVVLFWIANGVHVFRVDNPHTKPLPFWQWMIEDVKSRHPEAIFLAEAFTRPKPMYQLAKIGFSQSYTYFTWRHGKAELTEYLTELIQTEVADFFRPHFFVNTPDINPIFLQNSGRAGFLIRAALAATLSGLWGVYAGFELCEAEPLPGREEYLDSEKYELRRRPARAAGDIVDEIAALNRLRRAEPALQGQKGLSFHNMFNDNILYYSRFVEGHRDRILVAVSLDPHGDQTGDFEVPLWLFGLPDSAGVRVQDCLSGDRSSWTGKMQRVHLTLANPYRIWRIQPQAGADV